MKEFMDQDFLLESPTARELYHDYAAKMPIIDYHCHINPQEIAEDRRYRSVTEVWLGGDHYKWRAMRCNGVPEAEITGTGADPKVVFENWAATLPRCVGNPLYHWTYLELKQYFGITKPLNPASAGKIYEACNKRLAEPDMSVRGIIRQSNVKLICTTDDPVDDLRWHRQIKADATCRDIKVQPAFRPDKAMNIDKEGFADYIAKLADVSGVGIQTFAHLEEALTRRVEFFQENGCRVSDHALDYCIYEESTPEELDGILSEGLEKGRISDLRDANKFRTAVLLLLSRLYTKYNWVMQIHFGCIRNNSTRMFQKLGPDTGFDAITNSRGAEQLAQLLDAMDQGEHLPKMVLYSLNDADNVIIATLAGCFASDAGVASKIQLGSAWWFNDTKTGMEKQLTDLANLGVLGNFIGMLTDSRSFLSYTRHEYFRRILCNFMGRLVEKGEYHYDIETLGQLVQDICYHNTVRFFGFDVD